MHYPLIAILLLGLTACSSMMDDVEYRQVEETPRMQIPEGLDDSAIYDLYPVPPLSPYADKDYIYQHRLPNALLVGKPGDVKIQRLDKQQWIVVNDSPSRLWPRLKQFLSLQKMPVSREKGQLGLIEAKSEHGFYLLRVEQGFQRNTSEIYIRQLNTQAELSNGVLPVSGSMEQETKTIELLSQFLADIAEKPAYSYVARGISARPKMRESHDRSGLKTLILEVDEKRAKAAVIAALERAEFKLLSDDNNHLQVQYYPVLPESRKPGFWDKLMGASDDDFDEAMPYAGEYYQVIFTAGGTGIALSVERESTELSSERNIRNEKNQMLQLIKGYLS